MRHSVSDDGDEREGAVMPEESPTLVRSSNVFTPGDGHAVVAQRSCSYVAHIYVGGACAYVLLLLSHPREKPEAHEIRSEVSTGGHGRCHAAYAR